MGTYTHNGRTYTVRIEQDDTIGHPWAEHDGHGPVRKSRHSHRSQQDHKSPGERPLNAGGRNECQYYYNWQGAIMLAKREGWGVLQPGESARQRAERAVSADFDYLRRYLADQWHWAIVTVSWGDYSESLGGCECDYTDKSVEYVFAELAQEIESQIADDEKTARIRLCDARKRWLLALRVYRNHARTTFGQHVQAVARDAMTHAKPDVLGAVSDLRALAAEGVQS